MVEFSQSFIYRFSSSEAEKDAILVGFTENNLKTCRICQTQYKLSDVEYSIRMAYLLLELVELKATPLGAPLEFPIPLAGQVVSWVDDGK